LEQQQRRRRPRGRCSGRPPFDDLMIEVNTTLNDFMLQVIASTRELQP
jgi:hypothetical protein